MSRQYLNAVCYARRELDEMVCHECSFRWDVKDPEPPGCQRRATPEPAAQPLPREMPVKAARVLKVGVDKSVGRRYLDEMRRNLSRS